MSERPRISEDPLAAALGKAFADDRPSHGLQQRLARSLRALPSPARAIPGWLRVTMITAAAIVMLVLMPVALGPHRTELADVPLKELQAFIDSNRAVDVATNDPARVRAWLAERIDFAPPRVAPGDTRIELIGGRLCLFAGRRVASYMYRVHDQLLSIYVMTADGLNLTGGTRIERVGHTLAVMREGRLTQASWIADGLIYSVVGEFSESGLLATLDDLRPWL